MSRISRGTPAGDAYLDLKSQAKLTGRATQELLQLYILEGFLAQLAVSNMRERFVLKGGRGGGVVLGQTNCLNSSSMSSTESSVLPTRHSLARPAV